MGEGEEGKNVIRGSWKSRSQERAKTVSTLRESQSSDAELLFTARSIVASLNQLAVARMRQPDDEKDPDVSGYSETDLEEKIRNVQTGKSTDSQALLVAIALEYIKRDNEKHGGRTPHK